MSESVYLIREQGSGEPRVLPSPLIELMTNEKDNERPSSLSSCNESKRLSPQREEPF